MSHVSNLKVNYRHARLIISIQILRLISNRNVGQSLYFGNWSAFMTMVKYIDINTEINIKQIILII